MFQKLPTAQLGSQSCGTPPFWHRRDDRKYGRRRTRLSDHSARIVERPLPALRRPEHPDSPLLTRLSALSAAKVWRPRSQCGNVAPAGARMLIGLPYNIRTPSFVYNGR